MEILKKEITKHNNRLYYNNIDLLKLVDKYQTPLRITFLDVIKDHILDLKKVFDKVIKENDYNGKFIYVNANKANYEYLEVNEAYINGDGIECSSYYDLLLTEEIVNKTKDAKVKPIICNGIKGDDYLDKIVELANDGYNIIDVCDSQVEYEKLKEKNVRYLDIGLRIHISSLYNEEDEVILNDRFGMMDDEFDYIINDIGNHPNLFLSTIHFHQRGFDFEKDKFLINIEKVFEYYVKAYQKVNTICNFDIGGGTPLPINETFDYYSWARLLISELKKIAIKNNIPCPNIISENGKYSQKDSTINIYEVVSIKNTDEIPWYVLNGSLLIAMPEKYGLGEDILVLPINKLDDQLIRARLSSITCDCDDILYDKKLGYLNLPMINNDRLYIGIFGTGSYQNSMAGKGGWHHCLLPEEKDVVIYTKNNKVFDFVRSPLQDINKIKNLIHFPE